MTINAEWFKDKLKAMKLSQRSLAKLMTVDPAAISYMLQGKRAMSLEDARKIAEIIKMPVTEVMRQAGIDVRDDVRKVPIKGFITDGNIVTLLPNGTRDSVLAPADVPSKSFAIQQRRANHPYDGWIKFISGETLSPNDAIDRYCYCTLTDGRIVLGFVRRGYKAGTHNIMLAGDLTNVLENQQIESAARILWVQPH